MLQTPTNEDATGAATDTEVAYVGAWTPLGRSVVIEEGSEERPLPIGDPARPRGYAWGRAGTGPRELARGMLLDATANPMLAERLCRPLTWEVVANLPAEGFRITRTEIQAWIESQA